MTEVNPMDKIAVSFEKGDFVRMESFPHLTQMNTMPVIHFRGQEARPLGTCFVIGNQGLAVTALHVVEEAFGRIHTAVQAAPDNEQLVALYVSQEVDPETGHLVGGPLPIIRVWGSSALDLALLQLQLPLNTKTQMPPRLPALQLSPGIPDVGRHCFAFGYHTMEWVPADEVSFSVSQNYSASRGKIEEIHFPKRDSVFLPFPCFRTSSRFEGGMSGGPIVSETGQVCGVVCSAVKTDESDGTYTSYGSLIGPALALILNGNINGVDAKRFLYEFVVGGAVVVDASMKSINAIRDGNRLVLDFGSGRTLANEIS